MFFFVAIRHISRLNIRFIKELGEGAFGRVHLGLCQGLNPGDDLTMVAIKVTKICKLNQFTSLWFFRLSSCHIYKNIFHIVRPQVLRVDIQTNPGLTY